MLRRVAEFITRYSMLRSGARLGVAVSGGADSVCLLHALAELAPELSLQLSVLHLNHQLRGEESERDEQFVRDLAAKLGLPVTVKRWDRGREPEGERGNLEGAAREARMAFFEEAIRGGAVDCVAVGHTRSDQAETVLFRFLRGSGTAGLAGARPVTSAGIVRPLLAVDRAEVLAFLRERGIPWREDSSNADAGFARNRIRHSLLPQLAADWNPAIVETLADTADWAQAEEVYWEAEIARLEKGVLAAEDGAVFARAEDLRNLPVAAARRLIRRAFERVKGDLRSVNFQHVAASLELAASSEGHGRLQVPGIDVLRSLDWVRFSPPGTLSLEHRNFLFAVSLPAAFEVPHRGGQIRLELIDKSELVDQVYNGSTDWLDWCQLSLPLVLRNWRPGDQYQPAGRTGEVKIKTLFQDHRIPLWERARWPVLMDGGSVVWARQFGAASRLIAGSAAQTVLRIRDTGAAGPTGTAGAEE